jgi:PDZ domain
MRFKRYYAYCLFVYINFALLSGCATGYKEFYRQAQGMTPEVIAARRATPAPVLPTVERSRPGEPQQVLDAYMKRGYVTIGNSFFNSGRSESEEGALRQAKDVGADLVLLLDPKYTGSTTSSIPFTQPTTTTSYSTGSATAYRPGGSVTAYGSGTTTTYGSATSYIPVTTHRSDYGAIFFVKQNWVLGLSTRDLNDSERQELQSNKGVVVRIVVDRTPAFDADILIGDVVSAIDGLTVSNAQSFNDILRERRGKPVQMALLRRGQTIEKTIRLNP